MTLSELQESYLLSLAQDHGGLFVEFHILSGDNKIVKVFSHNKNTSPISIEFRGLNLHSNLTTLNGVHTLGEIEAIEVFDTGFSFEGNMGFITVKADTWFIEHVL